MILLLLEIIKLLWFVLYVCDVFFGVLLYLVDNVFIVLNFIVSV